VRDLGWLAIIAVGCGQGGGDRSGEPAVDGCELGGAPTLVVGTGDVGFEPVGDTVELVHGPQGGFHVYVGLEATHIDNSEFVAGVLTGTIGGVVVTTERPFVDFRCNPDTHTLQSWGTLLIYPLQPEELDQQETTITADIMPGDLEVSASLTTVIVDPILEGT
jgi:hypothetical protein